MVDPESKGSCKADQDSRVESKDSNAEKAKAQSNLRGCYASDCIGTSLLAIRGYRDASASVRKSFVV